MADFLPSFLARAGMPALVVASLLPAAAGAQAPAGVPRPPPPPAGLIDRVLPPAAPALSPRAQPPAEEPRRGPGEGQEVAIGSAVVQGNTAVPAADLRRILAGIENRTVALSRIEETRIALLGAYRRAGYPFVSVAAALAPLPDGRSEARFAITEGYVAEVRLDGDIGPAGTQVLRFLERVKAQRPVSTAAVERALLLASDVPGVRVRGVLQPIQGEPGALRLIAQLTRSPVSGYVNLDNRGYRLTGPWQGLLVGGLNSFTEYGERTELSLFGAEQSTQWFAQASVETFIGGSGLRLRLYAGTGNTLPSGQLSDIGYVGETRLAGMVATYPIIRTRPANLWAVAQFDAFDSDVFTGVGTSSGRQRAGRDRIRAVRGGFDGQALDTLIGFLPPATNQAALRLHQGLDVFGATRDGDPVVTRIGSEFGFTKATGEFQRVQPLFSPFDGAMVNVQAYVSGQWSDNVLPPAEKYYLGGARLGRGFYSGQVTGDWGYGYAIELQLDMAYEMPADPPLGNNRGSTQLYVFRDLGWAFQNLDTDADRRLSSWGGGVRLVVADTAQFDVEVARRFTTRPEGVAADPLRATQVYFRMLLRF